MRSTARRVISHLTNKNVVAKFEFWKSNVASIRHMSKEMGQTARMFYAAVKLLEGRRDSMLRWRSIRAWQQRALESTEIEVMCDKLGGFVDARANSKVFGEWRKTVRSLHLCRNAVERRNAWEQPYLMHASLMEWHSCASLASKRQQIIGILRSRLPRKIITAWTHSFAWRQCVNGRSVGRVD